MFSEMKAPLVLSPGQTEERLTVWPLPPEQIPARPFVWLSSHTNLSACLHTAGGNGAAVCVHGAF